MHKLILGEKLKEEINGKKVKAAVFHTFNFDPTFFEHYLLPLFLPEIPFGDNKIQNTILWKKFQEELPPITVYCDFHAKSAVGIHLDYTVKAIDLPRIGGVKPCFHPKQTAVLLEDDSLLIFIGSNNLTEAGWCSNLESINFFKLQSKVHFPRQFKDSLRNFNQFIASTYPGKKDPLILSPAEEHIAAFYNKIGYTEASNCRFISSHSFKNQHESSFFTFIEDLIQQENKGLPFKKVEIISPYFAENTALFEFLAKPSNCAEISCALPFENTDLVAMNADFFQQTKDLGIQWCTINALGETKGFRFNHSKIYQFLGEDHVFLLVGSINFTNMAWKGTKFGGNFESAVLYSLPAAAFESLLTPYSSANIQFSGNKPEEQQTDVREDAFKLDFIIDWAANTLEIINHDPTNQRGDILMNHGANIRINESKTIVLQAAQLTHFSNSPLIVVKPNGKSIFFQYYPMHKNIGAKPLPSNINLNDTELLQLWIDLEGEKDKETTLRMIDRFVERITDDTGEVNASALENTSSTLNLMATHLSGIIQLQRKLFGGKVKTDRTKMIEYYLFTDNVDTLDGYLKLIQKMHNEQRLNSGFYWLLLNIIQLLFYRKYESIISPDKTHLILLANKLKILNNEIKVHQKSIENNRLTSGHLKWAVKILLEDAE